MRKCIFFGLFLMVIHPAQAWPQSDDFFTNTQGIDSLSTGSGGACPTCPGFNPDWLIRHAGANPNASDATISFSQSITTTAPSLGGTVTGPFFNQLGPGAVTDNMFGIIGDPGPDPTKCGVFPIVDLSGLNCGDLRLDPLTQGMTIPVSPAADVLTSHVFSPSTFTGDFAPSTDDHSGIELENRFIWSRTTATLTDGSLSIACTPATFACVGSRQRQHQVTPLVAGGAGTLALPGSGEQDFDLTTDWSITLSSGNGFTVPIINWSLQFNDPIQDAVGNARFQSGSMSGSFGYNGGGAVFPTVTIPFVRNASDLCRGVAGTEGTCISIR